MTTFFADRIDTVESSFLKRIALNKDNYQIYVEFKNGQAFVYDNLDEEVYDEWLDWTSVGSYYTNYIKGRYDSEYFDGEVVPQEPTLKAVEPITDDGYYAVRWTTTELNVGPFEYVAHGATTEDEALDSLEEASSNLGFEGVKVLAVIHYRG